MAFVRPFGILFPYAHGQTVQYASCPEGKARIRVTDAGGLYLEVAGAGSKRWFKANGFNSAGTTGARRVDIRASPEPPSKTPTGREPA
jgi:hypothetical protein